MRYVPFLHSVLTELTMQDLDLDVYPSVGLCTRALKRACALLALTCTPNSNKSTNNSQ